MHPLFWRPIQKTADYQHFIQTREIYRLSYFFTWLTPAMNISDVFISNFSPILTTLLDSRHCSIYELKFFPPAYSSFTFFPNTPFASYLLSPDLLRHLSPHPHSSQSCSTLLRLPHTKHSWTRSFTSFFSVCTFLNQFFLTAVAWTSFLSSILSSSCVFLVRLFIIRVPLSLVLFLLLLCLIQLYIFSILYDGYSNKTFVVFHQVWTRHI